MRFLLDVDLSPKLVWEFRRLGHECEHVAEALDKNAKDREIAEFANRTRVILVSKDSDFVEFSNGGLLQAQLIWLRCGNMTAKDTCSVVRRNLPGVLVALKNGRKIIEIHDQPPTPPHPLR
jgi:predicted nuclease of predicted toxin-antitoxin system